VSSFHVSRLLGALALVLSSVALVLVIVAGPGTRFGLWDFRVGLNLLRWAAYGAFAGIAIGLVRVFIVGARTSAGIALAIGFAAAVVPILFLVRAWGVPMIHDITTDTDDPPALVTLRAARGPHMNTADYGGPEIAAQQHAAYPDLHPLLLAEPPGEAFERAEAAARRLGWEIAAADRKSGHIEATDTTLWFGFKDDVVIRVRPEGMGSRIDVRSVSRVGKSDVGTNARRIRDFLRQLAP
jgi:uncharacterized protein (DUF1499 family)